MSNGERQFCIFTEDGQRHAVEAPSLKTALRNFEGDPNKVLAVVDVDCLPQHRTGSMPFMAVLLSNPAASVQAR